MKKIILIVLLLTISAWKSPTHELIAEKLYYSMPEHLQEQINLTEMKIGSTAPDQIFKDFKNHHYPPSLEKVKFYLNNITSYNLGIITHYISDSYAAPHNIAKEEYYLHSSFEKQVKYYRPTTECKDYNLNLEDLKYAQKNSKDWYPWIKTRNKQIPEKEVEESMKILYSLMFNIFPGLKCTKKTEIKKAYLIDIKNIIILMITLTLTIYFITS